MRRWLIIGAELFGLLGLTWLLRAPVSSFLLGPALYLWWLAGVIYSGLPQGLLWLLFMFIASRFALQTLLRSQNKSEKLPDERTSSRGSVETWARAFHSAADGKYSRWRLARLLADQAIALIAFSGEDEPLNIRSRLASQEVEMPPDISAYFAAGLSGVPVASRKRKFLIGSRESYTTPLDLEPEIVINYLESIMEDYGSP